MAVFVDDQDMEGGMDSVVVWYSVAHGLLWTAFDIVTSLTYMRRRAQCLCAGGRVA
jgi:hypothetical protein